MAEAVPVHRAVSAGVCLSHGELLDLPAVVGDDVVALGLVAKEREMTALFKRMAKHGRS
jgi:hypothetical protein